ncbi:MAG: glycosyltransferase [Lachnospiraceae bacterium]|nr:glycosyltransferase [Lachnospiraceae bacterium]
MKFSIIVVALNPGEELLRTLESIARQSCTDYEVVVKDGGSKDGSVEALQQWLLRQPEALQQRVRIICEPDKSIYEGMNQATRHAQGEWFYFLNCGDYFYEASSLESMAAAMNGRDSLIFYGDIYDRTRRSLVASNPRINGFACYRNVPCHQACIYRRSLFAQRGYETKYKVRGDYEHFLWSFYEKQANPCYVSVILASYEGAGYSETAKNKERSAREHKEITRKYMSGAERFWYRFLLVITLQPLRTRIAEHPGMSKIYNKLKSMLYQKK